MLGSVNKTKDENFSTLLADSQAFFKELVPFFDEEVKLLMGPARAITKFVTAYVYKVALANTNKNIEHLNDMVAKQDPRLPEKLLHYLERTAEFLAKRAKNSSDSALFIPVPFHNEVAAKLKERADTCQALLDRARLLCPPSAKKAKSWLSLYLHYANTLPNIWTAGYGLGRDNIDKEIPISRLNELLTELSLLENSPELQTTKTTASMMQIEYFTQEPPKHADYHQHVPPLTPLMGSFKQYMTSQTERSKEGVHEAIKTTYPKPA